MNIKERLKQVLEDGLLDNIACHGKFKLDEVHLDNLTKEILELVGVYFLASVLNVDFINYNMVKDLAETILEKDKTK